MSGVNRLNQRRWLTARSAALERDGFRCVQCGKAGRLEVDHAKALDHGGAAYELGNLQTLCRDCHIEKTYAERSTPEQVRWRRFQHEIDKRPVSR